MKMAASVGRCLEKKTMLVRVMEYLNKNLQELYLAFKEKHQNINSGFSKFCTLRLKRFVLVYSKMTYSVCVCSAHQSVVLLVGAMEQDLSHKDLIKKIGCSSENRKCMMHRCETCPGTATPKELFIKHSTNMKMMRNLITVSGTLRIEQFCQPLQPLTNDDLT